MANIIIEEIDGIKAYRLENEKLCAWINPLDGMNLYRLWYKGQEVVSLDKKRLEAGATYGIPILFPTPNRTKDARFTFEGREYPAVIHGIVRKTPFTVEGTEVCGTKASIKGSLRMDEKHVLYKEYPFSFTLNVTIEISESQLCYTYEVLNQGKQNMPFGFALHPFFDKLGDEVSILVYAGKVMEKDDQLIPTGRLLSVANTPYDLMGGKKVCNLLLDDVYTDMQDSPRAVLSYDDFKVEIDTSPSFTHMVIYTPKNEAYFCVEPQTCSTDAINLYERGEIQASGLTVLPPKEQQKGNIIFHFK